MQRLVSLRLASNFARKALCDSTPISHPVTSFPTTRFFSRPWRSQAGSLSPKSHNLYSNPALAKAFSSHSTKAPLKSVAIKSFLNFRVAFQGLQRNLRPGLNFPSTLREWKAWLRSLSPDNLVLGLIIANTAVFMLWRVANSRFMMNNFTISVENLKSLRLHTLITSAFSHFDTGHIMHNMIGLYFFGSHLGQVFGPEFLLKMYLAGGIAGSVFYVVHSLFLASSATGTMWKDPLRTPGLGASGAVNAIILLDIFLHPRSTLLLNFFIPVPAVLLGIYLVGKDFMGMIEGDTPGSAHLGGAAVAAITWFRLRRGRF